MAKFKTKVLDEEVKVGEGTLGGVSYSHPSYGNIQISRVQGASRSLYASDLKHSSTIQLRVERGECTQDLGRSWYHGRNQILEIEFSPIQFAECITNLNSSGVPCTINYTESDGRIKYKEMPKDIEYIEEKISTLVNTQKDELDKAQSEIKEILNQKGTMKKADKEKLQKLTNKLANLSSSSLPFYADSARKVIDRSKVEAEMAIEAQQQHMITTIGIEALSNPEVRDILLQDLTQRIIEE